MRGRVVAIALALAALWGAASGAGAGDRARQLPAFVFGVVPQSGLSEQDLEQMSGGGVDSFRLWLAWSAVEPEPGLRDWGPYDSLIAAAAQRGVAPLPFLYGTPAWAAHADGSRCVGDICIPYAPRSDLTRLAFASFGADAVRRYGPGGTFWAQHPELPYHPVRSWQIWNEQNLTDYWRPEPRPADYAKLLAAAAPAIRAADPDADIVLGGMWGPRSAPRDVIPTPRYLQLLYRESGVRDHFDSIAVHPYDSRVSGVIAQVRKTRFVVRRHGDGGVEIWVTELGWASGGPSRESLVKDRREQARLLGRAFAELHERRQRWNLRGAYWYAWRDTRRADAICRWCPRAGLRSVSGAAKPSFHRLSALAVG